MEKKFEPLFLNWLLTIKKAQVLQRTFDKLMGVSKCHILPSLGNMEILEIDSAILQSYFINTLGKDKKLALSSVKKCRFLLNDFFDYCYKSDLVAQNPVENTSLSEIHKNKKGGKGIAPDKRQQFIDIVSSSRLWKPFCLTIMYTGLKIGEILPLKWQDINFENKTITIKNAIAANIVFADNGNVLKRNNYISPTLVDKTISLSDKALQVLTEHKKFREREQRQQKIYSYIDRDDLVFGNSQSELRSYTGISHLLARFLRRNGLEGITFSTLRHTYLEMEKEKKQQARKLEILEKKEAALALKTKQKNEVIAKYKNARQREIEMI